MSELEMPDLKANSPDLMAALLDFDASELAEAGVSGEEMLLRKAAEIKGWSLSGTHPRFYLNDWVEIVLMGKGRGVIRLLNGRQHHELKPLSLHQLFQTVPRLLSKIEAHHTPSSFPEQLQNAMAELDTGKQSIGLNTVYNALKTQQLDYSREAFGKDLAYALVYPPEGTQITPTPATGASLDRFWVVGEKGVLAIEALSLSSTENAILKSLEI